MSSMKTLLVKGQEVLLDDEDYELCKKYTWHIELAGYVCRATNTPTGARDSEGRKLYKTKKIKMHREINQTPQGMHTDHINRNKLDNRKANLRTVSHRQNMHNAKRDHTFTKVNYTGVEPYYLRKKDGKQTYKVYVAGATVCTTTDEIEGAYIYDQVAMQVYGEYASTNFNYV